jgi:hypothetical protein
VFESVTTPLKIEAREALDFLVVSVVVGLSATTAFVFGAVAVFYGTHQTYGALYASLAEIGYCLVVAALMIGIILLSRSRARRRAATRAEADEIARRRKLSDAPPMWKDAGVVGVVLPLLLKAPPFSSSQQLA